MAIQTGKIPVSRFTAASILSLSLVVNLPGLAISPMLGTLETIFPGTSQLEEQLLTVLPNLLIIPFVLLSGKLSLTPHKRTVVMWGLILYAAAGISYLFASSMAELIVISCLVGVGAGLIIPFSTGLIADVFSGRFRMKEMGLQSGISNATLVIATYAVGWLSHGNWHMPFLVYLIPLIPLAMIRGLKSIPTPDLLNPTAPATASPDESATIKPIYKGRIIKGFYIRRLISVICIYFFISYATIVISYYCPFIVEKKDWSSTLSGTVTSLYFLFIFIPGFALPWILRLLKRSTFVISALVMAIGLGIFAIFREPWAMCIGASLSGLGYGICQPLIYDKASRTVESQKKSTLALSFVLSANYLSVVLTPFIVDGLRSLLHAGTVTGFAFILNAILAAVFFIVARLCHNSFAFGVPEEYFSKGVPPKQSK